MELKGKHVLFGISGGIAAYKSALVVRLLRKEDAQVRVVLTEAAQKFITPVTMAALSENEVGLDLFDQYPQHEVRHIHWAEWADLALIAPATANLLGKAANGLADDLLSNLLLALQCPVVFAPAMHHQMWSHPAVQKNLTSLRGYGYHIIEPDTGELASGDTGIGRMREPEEIMEFLRRM
ncbi:MAG: flavoprotein [bacterium]|jgi:phosphopantothenoylcysteine decarboxylase/phosphopantothenate--cysteine ligase